MDTNFDPIVQIKNCTDKKYLKDMLRYIDIDIKLITGSNKILTEMKAKGNNVSYKKQVETDIYHFNKLKKVIKDRLEYLNSTGE